VGLGIDSFVEQHIGILASLVDAAEAFVFDIAGDVPFRHLSVVEFPPLFAHLNKGVVVTAFGRA
jgi:hypothetical protein